MSYYIGEIVMMATSILPTGMVECNGAVLNIADHPALYAAIGSTYGGDGTTTFAIPDMRGRTLIGRGVLGADTYVLGTSGGEEAVVLTTDQIPEHSHSLNGIGDVGTGSSPAPLAGPLSFGEPTTGTYYTDDFTTTANIADLSTAGSNIPHSNMQPSLGLRFCIVTSNIGVA